MAAQDGNIVEVKKAIETENIHVDAKTTVSNVIVITVQQNSQDLMETLIIQLLLVVLLLTLLRVGA